MSAEIKIDKELSKALHEDASKAGKSFSNHIWEKYHSPDRIPIFEKKKDKIYKRSPLIEKVEISEGDFKLFEALNEMVITIRHARKLPIEKRHEKNTI